MPNPQPGQPIWGGTRPVTIPFIAQVGVQALYPRSCRLLSAQFNNGGGVATTVTLWDGSNNAGNDNYGVLLAAGATFQAALMDVGLPFNNGIVMTQSAANVSGYLLIADDDGS